MIIINNTTSEALNELTLKKIGQNFLQSYHKEAWSVSLAIIGPARMRRLNQTYRGLDRPTDVLSFPAGKTGRAEKYLGEILINLAEIKKIRQYQELFLEIQGFTHLNNRNISSKKRQFVGRPVKKLVNRARVKQPVYLLYFLFVHGLLHLLGYNDESVKGRQTMLRRGGKFLANLGYLPEINSPIQ